MDKIKKQSLKETISKKIKNRELKMKPEFYFALKDIIITVTTLITVFVSVFFISFVLFSLRISGVWFLFGFGFEGLKIFLASFPWFLLLIGISFALLIAVLIQNFEFSWRRPFLYSVFAVLIFVLFFGVATAKTSFHQRILEKAQKHNLPVAGHLYLRYVLIRPKNTRIGTVLTTQNNVLKIKTQEGKEVKIAIPKTENQMPAKNMENVENIKKNMKTIKEKDPVIILLKKGNNGSKEGKEIELYDIHKLEKNNLLTVPSFKVEIYQNLEE